MLAPGDTFDRYTVEALLGQGGMGAVYRARDARLERRVALKVISDTAAGAEADARLLREARAAAALDHPNAVAIFDVGEHDGAPFIVMELVEGKTLRSAVGESSLPLATRVGYLADVARALAGAHKKGLVHRDIKPENVMVRDDGMVKVLDFGIARRGAAVDPHAVTQTPALSTLTMEGVKLGTPVYMAPEQIRGDALDGRADQFSWGVLAYELCAGRLPWRGAGDALSVLASVLTDPVDRAPLDAAGVSPAVQEVLLRALAKRPDDRFASMDDLLRSLDAGGFAPRPPLRAVDAAAKDDGASSPERASTPQRGATEAQRFSTSEVREVLGKAVEKQAAKQASGKLGFEDLLAVAAEVGVDADSLRDASRALRAPAPGAEAAPQRPPADEARAWVRRQKRLFQRHLGVYVVVNAALLVLGLVLLGPWTPWWVWFLPALGWGIGVAIHAVVALTAHEDDYREEREQLQWWREQRERRHQERMAMFTGGRYQPAPPRRVEAPRAGERRRVEAPPEPEREKVRVAPSTDTGDLAAEEEAAAAEPSRQRRQR